MNSLLLCCGLALAAPAAASATPAADASADTYVLCGNRACALVDRDGHLVTPRLFEQVEPLEHGLAVFGKDEHHGVVDRAGHTVVPPVYDVLHLLADGRIWASRKDAKGNDEPVGDLFDATGHLLGRGEDPPDPPDSPPADGPAVEILRTADGQALGDGHGRRISEAFDRIFPPYDDAQSMLAVRERDGRKSMGQLFLDGRLLPFPPDAQIDEFHEGLAVLRRDFPPAETGGRPRMRMGLVDAQGRVVLPATFDEVRPVHDGLAAVRLGKLWGIADRSGRLRVPPTYPWMDFKAHDGRFAVRIADGGKAGVIDGDGRWIVPAGYKSVQWVDDGLVAATNASIDAQGREDSTTLLFTRDGERLPAPPMHYPPYAMRALPLLRFHGLDDREGLMDRRGAVVAYDVQDNEPDTVRGPYFVRRGNDWAVVAAYGGELSPRRFGDIKQPYRHGRAVADEQLLDEHGRVLASFASVAPQAAADDDLDPEAAERVDPCYSLADLTADPADPPSAAIPAGLRPVCADPGLRASLRDARWRYAVRLADVDDPLPFVLEQAAFDARVRACADAGCRQRALADWSAAADRIPVPPPTPDTDQPLRLPSARGKVPPALRAALQKSLLSDLADAALGPGWSWQYVAIGPKGERQVLATVPEGERDFAFGLWARRGGRWRLLLSNDGMDGGPWPARPRRAGAWPDLVVAASDHLAHGSVSVYRYEAGSYRLRVACDDLSTPSSAGKDDVTLRFCDVPHPGPAPARAAR